MQRRITKHYIPIAIIIIVSGYMFFFLFSIFRSDSSTKFFSELGEMAEINGHTFQLISWNYSESQDLMEIIIDVTNKTLDGNNDYDISVFQRFRSRPLETKVIVSQRDLLVIQVFDLKKDFPSLRIDISFDKSTQETPVSFYMNKEHIKNVDNISEQPIQAYYLAKVDFNISNLEKEIENYRSENEQQSSEITLLNEQIQDLQNNMLYMTSDQQKNAESEISSKQSTISNKQTLMTENEGKIQDLESQIKNLEETKELIQFRLEELK